jgi:hypothetical protein
MKSKRFDDKKTLLHIKSSCSVIQFLHKLKMSVPSTQYAASVYWTNQVTLVIRAFAIRVFAYPRFYFSIMRSVNSLSYPRPNFKAYYLLRTLSRLIRECETMVSLASEHFGITLTSKWRLLYVSRFTHFRYTWRLAGTQPPCITRVTCYQIYPQELEL